MFTQILSRIKQRLSNCIVINILQSIQFECSGQNRFGFNILFLNFFGVNKCFVKTVFSIFTICLKIKSK